MSYCGYVTELKNVRKHNNADRLLLGDCFGNTVCVSLNYTEGQLGVYFPCDGQLSEEFAKANNLLRLKDENGHSIPGGGYMDPDKRNVTAIKLRGEKSDGIFLPLHCLESFGDITQLRAGDTIDVFNGHEICKKYIPKSNKRNFAPSGVNKRTRKRAIIAQVPTFYEHKDTEQLAYNLDAFKPGDYIEITLKMHGTSQRTGNLPVITYKRNWFDKLFNLDGKPVSNRECISGTRRTVLHSYDGGYYGDNEFREKYNRFFNGKLWKGETVYYEVVGFTDKGVPIMNDCNNAKTKDEEFIKQYGETTRFSYGCSPEGEFEHYTDGVGTPIYGGIKPGTQNDIYVYRMTMVNEDGDVVEYTPNFMRYRCEQMGVKTVPVFWSGIIPENPASADDDTITAGEWVKNKAEQFYDGPDPIGKTNVREGVVVRIINRPIFAAYKHKNFNFKVLEGIVKADAEAPDMEEAEALIEEENLEINN